MTTHEKPRSFRQQFECIKCNAGGTKLERFGGAITVSSLMENGANCLPNQFTIYHHIVILTRN